MKFDRHDGRATMIAPPCFYCKHLTNTGTQDLKGWTCPAYPREIPKPILTRQVQHLTVLSGQDGEDIYESKVISCDDGLYTITFDGNWIPVLPKKEQ
jgi:hypothetical protein